MSRSSPPPPPPPSVTIPPSPNVPGYKPHPVLDEATVQMLLQMPPSPRQVAYNALTGAYPDGAPVVCEATGCGRIVTFHEAVSIAAIVRWPGGRALPFQCDEQQHWGCCLEHAEAAMIACWHAHIKPKHAGIVGESLTQWQAAVDAHAADADRHAKPAR